VRARREEDQEEEDYIFKPAKSLHFQNDAGTPSPTQEKKTKLMFQNPISAHKLRLPLNPSTILDQDVRPEDYRSRNPEFGQINLCFICRINGVSIKVVLAWVWTKIERF